ncbi:MAG: radical SAM protein [Parcubacteria group bacterium]|jgi:uncharacterized protein
MKNALKFSKFVHFFEKNGITAIFHALSREVVFVTSANLIDMRNYLSQASSVDVDNEAIKYLVQKNLVVAIDMNEDESLKSLQESILQHPSIDTLYLLLTNNCNFGCTYCFFEGSYDGPKEKAINMTKDMAIASVRQFAGFLKKACEYTDFHPYEPSIVFYGGEPFINADIFFVAVEEVAALKRSGALPQNLTMNVNTNGSLINHEIASFCAKHNIEVDVSLDGYQSVHDACRVWLGKSSGTFDDVVRGISILKEVGAKACISCTVSEANVDKLPQIFNWFLDDVGISNVGFNPLLNSHQYKINDSGYPNRVAHAMIECFEIARERGIYEARMMRKVKAFVDGTIYDRDCCGCGKQVVILPNGKIGVCHAYSGTEEFFVNPDPDFDPFEHPFWKEWSKRSPINMPKCHNCEALTICGGGCPHNAEMNNGSIWDIDDNFCIHAKETLNWLIWDLYEQTK